MRGVLTVILAGGKGTRLEPLTRDRAKPAVPFGGLYRIIDFTLSNCINSDLRRILVLTQYKARSLDRHIQRRAGASSAASSDEYDRGPAAAAAHRRDTGTRAPPTPIYQNIYTHREGRTRATSSSSPAITSTRWTTASMIRAHIEREADLTIGCIPVPLAEGKQFGIMQVDERRPRRRLPGEAADRAEPMPGDPAHAWRRWASTSSPPASCTSCSARTRRRPDSDHDFGKNIIPAHDRRGTRVFAYPLPRQEPQGRCRTGATSARSTPTTRRTWT